MHGDRYHNAELVIHSKCRVAGPMVRQPLCPTLRVELMPIVILLLVGTQFFADSSAATANQHNTQSTEANCVCGPMQVSILLFDFEDVKHNPSSTPEKYRQILRDMNASFYEQSYGKMWLTGGNVYDWSVARTKLWQTISLRGLNVTSSNVFFHDEDAMVLGEAAAYKAKDLAIRPPIPTGSAGQQSNSYIIGVFAGDVWAWAYSATYRTPTDTLLGYNLAIIGETWGVVTFMHEFAHLMGLPDLPESTMGHWDLIGPGSSSGRLCAWSRLQLGWLGEQDVASLNTTRAASVLILESVDDPSGIRAMKMQISEGHYGENIMSNDLWAEAQNGKLAIYLYRTDRVGEGFYWDGWGYTNYWVYRPNLRLLSELSKENTPAGRVFVSQEINLAIILLETTTDGVKIKVTNTVEGKKAEQSLIALEGARRSYESAASFPGDVLDPNWKQTMSQANEALAFAWESFRKGDFDSAIASAMKSQENARNAEELVRKAQEQAMKAQEEQARLQTATMWLAVAGCLVLVVVIGYVRWHRKPKPKQEKMDRYTA